KSTITVAALGIILSCTPSTGATSYTYTDLTPNGFTVSYGEAASSGLQVGYGWGPPTSNIPGHALLWSGSASSVVDLNPPGFVVSAASDISGNQQVGDG